MASFLWFSTMCLFPRPLVSVNLQAYFVTFARHMCLFKTYLRVEYTVSQVMAIQCYSFDTVRTRWYWMPFLKSYPVGYIRSYMYSNLLCFHCFIQHYSPCIHIPLMSTILCILYTIHDICIYLYYVLIFYVHEFTMYIYVHCLFPIIWIYDIVCIQTSHLCPLYWVNILY